MENSTLIDREFKVIFWKKLNKLQENFKCNELRNKINAQNEYFTKEIDSLKQNQTEIMELRYSINKMKNALENTGNKVDHM